MVKINQLYLEFNKNSSSLYELSFNYDHKNTIFVDEGENKFTKTKISFQLFGSFFLDSDIFKTKQIYFKSYINFLVIDSNDNLFIRDVSINEIVLTDKNYLPIDNFNDDAIENLIYFVIEKIFFSCIPYKKNNLSTLNFSLPIKETIENNSIVFTNLSCKITIGVFFHD